MASSKKSSRVNSKKNSPSNYKVKKTQFAPETYVKIKPVAGSGQQRERASAKYAKSSYEAKNGGQSVQEKSSSIRGQGNRDLSQQQY